LNIRHLRKNIAIVSQEPNLFHLTIGDNIRYGLEALDDESIIDAAKQANIHDFIRTLPHVRLLKEYEYQ
jgi:ABC-type multidrug transport system fused ATPase/permease subunit